MGVAEERELIRANQRARTLPAVSLGVQHHPFLGAAGAGHALHSGHLDDGGRAGLFDAVSVRVLVGRGRQRFQKIHGVREQLRRAVRRGRTGKRERLAGRHLRREHFLLARAGLDRATDLPVVEHVGGIQIRRRVQGDCGAARDRDRGVGRGTNVPVVHHAVAVVVLAVADLGSRGLGSHRALGARAILLALQDAGIRALAHADRAGLTEVEALICVATAVVVHGVALLGDARIDGRISIVAVVVSLLADQREAGRHHNHHGSVAVAVAVIVAALVRGAVAIVVHVVALLGRGGWFRRHRAYRGQTVLGADQHAGIGARTHADRTALAKVETLVRATVAVVVECVAGFCFAGIPIGIPVVAVPSAIRTDRGLSDRAHGLVAIPVAVLVAALVGQAVAVIVLVIADFGVWRFRLNRAL